MDIHTQWPFWMTGSLLIWKMWNVSKMWKTDTYFSPVFSPWEMYTEETCKNVHTQFSCLSANCREIRCPTVSGVLIYYTVPTCRRPVDTCQWGGITVFTGSQRCSHYIAKWSNWLQTGAFGVSLTWSVLWKNAVCRGHSLRRTHRPKCQWLPPLVGG